MSKQKLRLKNKYRTIKQYYKFEKSYNSKKKHIPLGGNISNDTLAGCRYIQVKRPDIIVQIRV